MVMSAHPSSARLTRAKTEARSGRGAKTLRLGSAGVVLAFFLIACTSAAPEGETPSPGPTSPAGPPQTLTLPLGKQDGIEVGMRFPVANHAATVGEVEVVRVFGQHCRARFVPFRLDWAVVLPRSWELAPRGAAGNPRSFEAIVYEFDDRRRTIVVSAGAANGVEVGMHVNVLCGRSGIARARIVKVHDAHSIASVVEVGPGVEIRRGDPVWGGR